MFFQNDYTRDEEAHSHEVNMFYLFLVLLAIYFGLGLSYIYQLVNIKTAKQRRVQEKAGSIILIFSVMTVSLVGFPFESQSLQFMNENGLINIFIIVVSYLFAPNNDPNQIEITEEDITKV